MSAYYNDNDPYCVQWLKNLIAEGLIADGDVDGRDIRDVRPQDLRGYRQVHFFAGIGGWSYALRLAGWPDDREAWTGSCPCQPFSSAGKRKGTADARHLWPDFARLISECAPSVVFGEQVARAHDWLAGVRSDLEAMGYAVGAMPIEAASIGAPHKRDRYWFVAHANSTELRHEPGRRCGSSGQGPAFAGEYGALRAPAHAHGEGEYAVAIDAEMACASQPVADADCSEQHGWGGSVQVGRVGCAQEAQRNGYAGGIKWAPEPAVGRVAHGIPARVGKLRALGNAIVPQVAAEFIQAYCEAREAA